MLFRFLSCSFLSNILGLLDEVLGLNKNKEFWGSFVEKGKALIQEILQHH